MCRILFLQGTNTQKAKDYLNAFFQAGENDPYLEEIVEELDIPKIKNQHIHGWGYILVTPKAIHNYTSGDFSAKDTDGRKTLLSLLENIKGEFLLMAELRVTDEGYVSALNSHPFHFISRNGYEGYLFYNGLLDYEKLAKNEGIDFDNYSTKNGTTLMGISISRALEEGNSMLDAVKRPKKALKSAYNLMIFYRNNTGKYKAFIQAFIQKELSNTPCVFQHNKLLKRFEKDIKFIGSSSIEIYNPGKYDIMENGETQEFDLSFIQEYYVNSYDEK